MDGGLGRARRAIQEAWTRAYSEGTGGRALIERHEAACLVDE
jgi:hypothetical protein